MANLPGKDTSVWLDTTAATDYSKLKGKPMTADVAVVGGGITGVLAAYFLQTAGLQAVIVEKERIVENTTGNTTAKLTSQHYLVYHELVKKHGKDVARTYGKVNQKAIDGIEDLAKKLDIDCDFERRDAYVYTNKAKTVSEIEREVEVAQSLGLPASLESTIDLPYPVKAAIKFSHQAQFHPRKFLLGIAGAFTKAGGSIYEETEATGIKSGSPATLETKNGSIRAKYIVEASKYPFWRPDIFEKAMWRKLSYALGVRIQGKYPQGMYITTDQPIRTLRSHPYKKGQILIFGGDSHKLTKDYDKSEHYRNLVNDVKKRFDVEEIVYRWVAGDNMPYDLMPYIGAYPDQPNIYIATGFRAWGLAWGMAAAQAISESITAKPPTWAKPFSLDRLKSKQEGDI